jgi:hypothetical protein
MVELTIIGPDRRLERIGRKRPEKTSPLSADPFKLDVKPPGAPRSLISRRKIS